MPVRRVGDYCASCLIRPALHDGLCRPCEELERCFPGSRRDVEPLTELEVDLTISLMTRRERFNTEIWKWVSGKESM